MSQHINVVVVLNNGTHETFQAYSDASYTRVQRFFHEVMQVRRVADIRGAFVACGAEMLTYTAGEVEEIACQHEASITRTDRRRMMTMTAADIDAALRLSGYTDNKVARVDFRRFQDGMALYDVTFDEVDDDIADDLRCMGDGRLIGPVFVMLKDGRLYAEF